MAETDWKKVKDQLLNIREEINELVEWFPGRTLSSPFFKTREVVEKYFPGTPYLADLNAMNYAPNEQRAYEAMQDRIFGIVNGLLTRIDLIVEGGEEVIVPKDVERELRDLKTRTEALANQSEDYVKTIKELSNRLESERKLQEERYKDLAKTELLKQEQIFNNAAKENRKYSWYWLGASALMLALLGLLLWYFFQYFCTDLSCFNEQKKTIGETYAKYLLIYELTRATIFRLAIISLAVYFLVFLIKNYNALMHNYTVNTQKANSFAAAFAMINGAISNKGKDDILSQAGHSIFSHQNTGYIGKDNEPSNPLLIEKVIEKISSPKD